MKVEGSIDMVSCFTQASLIYFPGGVFAVHIDDSTCPTTHVMMTPRHCGIDIVSL